MGITRFCDLDIGGEIPELTMPPISRTQLALFAGASGDHNPIHLDDEAAQNGGLPGVIAHGMLNMAFLAQVITAQVPASALRAFSARFLAMTFPGDVVTLKGKLRDRSNADGEDQIGLDLVAVNQKGETILQGSATVAVGKGAD